MTTIKISQLPDATTPLTGNEVIPLDQNGITKKAPAAFISPVVSVKAYGAVGDGVTDDTAAIQAAVNAEEGVFFPTGTYKVSSAISIPSNRLLSGEGASSVISYFGGAASQGALYVNSGSASAYVDNIIVQDLKVLGQVASLGFNEFIHNISFNGVRNCVIQRCVIEGFRGDGIYIGSGDVGGQERHNINVTIRDCYIDGVNKQNRNGISVIDGNGVNIDNNYITRTTRAGVPGQVDMPGAIDIEPDANVFHVVRDISIRNNKIFDCNSGVAAIGVLLPGVVYTTPPTGFNIENNYIDTPNAPSNNSYGIFFQYGSPFTSPPSAVVVDSTPNLSIRVTNNVVRFPTGAFGLGRGFVLWNCNDVVMDGNTFVGGAVSYLGYPNTNVINFTLSNNEFISVNGSGDYAVSVFNASRLNIVNNIFKDCGGVAGAARGAIEFNASNFIDNSGFVTDTVWTKGTGWSIGAGVATKSPGTASSLSQTMTPTSQLQIAPGATYQLVYTITRSAGSITPRFTGGTTVNGTTRSASGTYTETITALSGNTTIEFAADASFDGTVDNVALWSGTTSYVKINGNTFTSPGGTFTQQAVRNAGHFFNRDTNTFLGNIVVAGTNQFECLLIDNENGLGFNAPPLPETMFQVRGALRQNSGVSLPVLVDGEVPSTATNTAVMYRTAPTTQTASFTLTNLIHYQALQGTLGAGSTVTNQFGYFATDTLVDAAGNNFGFYGAIPAGSGRFNFYAAGTAPNVFAGSTVVGTDALATTATSGFLYIPTCAGAPTGVPAGFTGTVPIVFDTTNNKLYVYDGAWLSTAALT
jgi:hypothetical protein